METLSSKQLHNLPVFNTNNEHVGVVIGFVLDAPTQHILQYEIASHVVLGKSIGETRLIDRDRVVSLNQERLVVDDEVRDTQTSARKLSYNLGTSSS